MDTTPQVVKAATVAVVELLVDVEAQGRGRVAVCRQVTIRPADAKGRWSVWTGKSGVPLALWDHASGLPLPNVDGGRLTGLGRVPIEALLQRYLTFWGQQQGLRPGRRARTLTPAVLSAAADIAREHPARPVRAVADRLKQLGVKTPSDPENRRAVAQRIISRAIEHGLLPADAPGLRRAHNPQGQREGKA